MATWIIVILLAIIAVAVAGPLLLRLIASMGMVLTFIVSGSLALGLAITFPGETAILVLGVVLIGGLLATSLIQRSKEAHPYPAGSPKELRFPADRLRQMVKEAEEIGDNSFRHNTGIYIWRGPKGGLKAFPTIGRLRDFLNESENSRTP